MSSPSRPSRSEYADLGSASSQREAPLHSLRPESDTPPPAPTCVQESAALVVGGGTIGSLTAAMLHFRGVDVTLVEKEASFEKFDISRSYTQVLMKRGVEVAKLFPGLLDAINAHAVKVDGYGSTRMEPDGKIVVIPSPVARLVDQNYRLMRTGIVTALKEYLRDTCPRVTTMYGTEFLSVSTEEDGWMQASLRTEGKQHAIRTRLIFACDGRNSVVTRELSRIVGNSLHNAHIMSSYGLTDTVIYSPTTNLTRKTILFDRDLIDKLGVESSEDHPHFRRHMVLVGKTEGRPSNRSFNMSVFPLRQDDMIDINGRIASTIKLPNHAIWKIKSMDEGFALFQENFPQVDVRNIISEENMREFVKARPSQYGPVRHCKSLVAHIGSSSQGGIVLLGDCLHSFSPETAQGTNSGFEDVAVLGRIFDDADTDVTLYHLLRTFENERVDDVKALAHIARHAYPWMFQHSKLGLQVWKMNTTVRLKLSERFPQWFYPPMFHMMIGVLPYREICRRGGVTTRRILYVFVVIVIVLSALLYCLLSWLLL